MQFTWDEKKAAANARKHRVSFEEAATVLDDPHARVITQDHAGEVRYEITAFSTAQRCLYVIAAERTDEWDDTEVLRIISARRATSDEEKRYEEDRRKG